MTTLQKTIIGTTLAIAVGTGVYQARVISDLNERNQTLTQQQAPLADQVKQLQQERDDSADRLSALADEIERIKGNSTELLRLRGEIGVLRQETNKMGKLRGENRRLRTTLERSALASLPSQGRLSDASRMREPILPGFINWRGQDVNQVLQIYADLVSTNTKIDIDQEIVRRWFPLIVFTNSQELTSTEFVGVIEQLLKEQARINIQHPSSNRITISPQ